MNRRSFLARAASGVLALGPLAAATAKGTADRKRTGYVFDERFLEYRRPGMHPETPERLRALNQRVVTTGLLDSMTPLPLHGDPMQHVPLIHTAEHIEAVTKIAQMGEAAPLSVAGTLAGVDAVCAGTVRNAFCAIRPPGHHSRNTKREEGFCYYNNIAIAARYSQKVHGLERVLIVDWDYHHGNGTELAFYEDDTVLFFSTHNARDYPGTGSPKRRGAGKGEGFNINVHLPRGSTDADMLGAWERKLLPAAEKFRPDIVLISSGFDSRKDDLLGTFKVTDKCFARMTRMAVEIADTHCKGRLVSLLEGGYYPTGVALAAKAHLEALLDS
jgi:acetoin utilization deacetylase AcuC-like enzyme